MSSPVARFEVFDADRAPDSRWAALAEPYENDRVAALRDPSDRVAYVSAHLLLRDVAAELVGHPAEELQVRQQCPGCGATGHGRPEVRGHRGLALSLSHAVHRQPGRPDRVAVAALAAWSTTPVGIDVEFAAARVPDRALAPAERVAVAAGTDPVALWTRKEACVKAGLATLDSLATVDVWSAPEMGPAVEFTDWEGDGVRGCWVQRR